ncbi:MAG: transporter substrate-binding domain-containing protein [Lachnospiraceae bacterium]|nr:transporter substrate-binding domain-containing protein [Lachnospiraceae bacterium]
MKKKLLSVVLAAAMVFSMAACGSQSADQEPAAETAITGSADLPGKTIGVQLGTTGDSLATEYESQGSTVERYNKGADAIQALKQGKVDCVIIDNNPAKAFVEKNDDLVILDEEMSVEEYAMCLSKENEELLADINEALDQLEENGTLAEIESNYIGDEAGQHPYESPEGTDRSNGTLIMATNAAFEPYEYYANQEIVGIDPDIAQAVCDILGYELKIEDMEFDSIINAVVAGKADIGVAGMTVTEDRKLSVNFTDPYTKASQVIIVRK